MSLLYSFCAQTYENWELILVHDGPLDSANTWEMINKVDPRIQLLETKERKLGFGHPHRHKTAVSASGQYVIFTNDDNYYAPVFLHEMVHAAIRHKVEFVYCDLVHSHSLWQPFKTEPKYQKLDVGAFMASMALVKRTPWTDFSFRGDGTYINALVKNVKRKVIKVSKTLMVHN